MNDVTLGSAKCNLTFYFKPITELQAAEPGLKKSLVIQTLIRKICRASAPISFQVIIETKCIK